MVDVVCCYVTSFDKNGWLGSGLSSSSVPTIRHLMKYAKLSTEPACHGLETKRVFVHIFGSELIHSQC